MHILKMSKCNIGVMIYSYKIYNSKTVPYWCKFQAKAAPEVEIGELPQGRIWC